MQSKKLSIIESIVNVIGGILLAVYIAQPIIFNFYEIQMTTTENFEIAIAFTVFSFIRSYVVRRIFNRIR